jgi:hypothetical protein
VTNPYSDLLRRAAEEVTQFSATVPEAESALRRALAQFIQLLIAAAVVDASKVDGAIKGLTRFLIDELPTHTSFAPSFGVAHANWQSAKRRERAKRHKGAHE